MTFTATVTVAAPSGVTPPAPTGTVTFYDGATALATVGLNASNQATLTTSALLPGVHAIVAVYNGDSLTQMNQSATLTETVAATSQSVVYVNSAWAGDASGTQVTVGTSTHTIGTDAFATIQAGVAGVAAGGTVNVLAGTYSEQVTIGQSLILAGAGASSTTLDVPSGASGGGQIAILGNPAVTISGLTLAGSPLLTGIADDSGGTLTATGVVISGDDVGLSVEGGSTATITGSSITGDYTGAWVANAGSATVTQSAITGCTTGILVGNGGGDVSTLTAQDDKLSGDVMGVQDVQDPTDLQPVAAAAATLDWWGSLTGPTSSANPGGTGTPIAGNVGATPWIGVYTDGTLSGQPGFDPTSITAYAVPTQLVFTAEPSASAIEGQTLAAQPIVKAEDASGNLGINFNGSVALTLSTTSGSGTLAARAWRPPATASPPSAACTSPSPARPRSRPRRPVPPGPA